MKDGLKGEVLLAADVFAYDVKMKEVAAVLGTSSSNRAAQVSLFFGPTLLGYDKFVDAIGLDLNRALLAGHEVEWARPFKVGEPLRAEFRLTDHTVKNGSEIGRFETVFTAPDGEVVQKQYTTFIERAI